MSCYLFNGVPLLDKDFPLIVQGPIAPLPMEAKQHGN